VVGRCTFAVPGDLSTPTGGYAYDRRMIAELGDLGWQIDLLDLGEGFPWPDDATRTAAQTQLLAIPTGRIIVVDGLALGVLPEAAKQLAGRNPLLALVHHPLALEWGLTIEQAGALRASERTALATVRGVVVTSNSTARLVAADYAVPAECITVARPGSDPAPLAQRSRDGVVQLLSVGAVVPRKGFDVLIAALATLPDLSWRLTIAGDRTRDRDAAAQLAGAPRGALCRSRRVRARIPFRRLRHGLCGGCCAWPACHRHKCRRDTGHGAAGRQPARRSRRCQRIGAGAAPRHRR
jgi:glycosyltransferase involved in cell wall biosynthesis